MLMHYGSDKTMSQPGKSVLACFYNADFESWDALYKNKEKYAAAKAGLERDALSQMEKRYPGVKGNIEVLDTATPKTYERYLNAWRGSWMGWMTAGDDAPKYHPGVLPGLQNFIIVCVIQQTLNNATPRISLPEAGGTGNHRFRPA
jgi:phytoene dehydrogenase-like protein